jgi:hypothetical protein
MLPGLRDLEIMLEQLNLAYSLLPDAVGQREDKADDKVVCVGFQEGFVIALGKYAP